MGKRKATAEERPLLEVRELTWQDAQSIARRLHPDDAYECAAMGRTPEGSMAWVILSGQPSWCVYRTCTGTPVGAFGFTTEGTIWSLWTALGRRESLMVLEHTRPWVTRMATDFLKVAEVPNTLSNLVAKRNQRGITWLKMSKCFGFGTPVEINGEGWLPFFVKEDILNV